MKNSVLVVFGFVFLTLMMSGITAQNQATIYISEPDDFSYTEGATGNYIEWDVSFDSPLHYSVNRNGTVLNLGGGYLGSNSGNITICVDGRSVGTWYYLLIVDDGGENVELDLVIVTVNPSVYPILASLLSVVVLISVILVLSVWRIKKR